MTDQKEPTVTLNSDGGGWWFPPAVADQVGVDLEKKAAKRHTLFK